ncbi:cell division protein ZipA [Alteromonas gracilis]|uniref:cell division protein ZipA n=1 Tax=Alteromonas gracilis TaxID=1479524 RepID=UPI00373522DD
MEDQLRLFLLLGGTVFIIAVLAHGIWKIRKNSKPTEKERLEPRQWQDTDDDNDYESDSKEGFDELGIGAVRVVGKEQAYDSGSSTHDVNDDHSQHGDTFESDHNRLSQTSSHQHHQDSDEGEEQQAMQSLNKGSDVDLNENQAEEPKLYGSVVTNPKPHMKGQSRFSESAPGKIDNNVAAFPEPPGFLLKEGSEDTVDENGSFEDVRRTSQGNAQDISRETEDTTGSAQANEHQRSVNRSDRDGEEFRVEPTRAAQKFYVDPTLEEAPELQKTPARNEREVADFSLDAPEESFSSSELQGEAEQTKRFARSKRNKSSVRRREEPNFGDDQMRIDFDTSEASTDYQQESFSANASDDRSAGNERAQETAKSPSVEPEVLVLNVRMPEGEPIAGAALLPMLLTLGFKFGDQDIFHRHVNSNGKGPVLFSLANMFKPGVFDIDNLENFETQGVSLFMILPIEGDPHQVFNMMHNAARKLADEFGAQVLDGRRSVLTKQGLQQYVEKIREFERKRMIARN